LVITLTTLDIHNQYLLFKTVDQGISPRTIPFSKEENVCMNSALQYEDHHQNQGHAGQQQQHADTLSATGMPALQPATIPLTRIFSAFAVMLAVAIALWSLVDDTVLVPIMTGYPIFSLAWRVFFCGVVLACSAIFVGGLPIAVSAWRSTPRVRWLLVAAILAPFVVLPASGFLFSVLLNLSIVAPIFTTLLNLIPASNLLPVYIAAFVSTLLLNRAIQQAAIPDQWLRLARIASRVVAFSFIVSFLGLLSWGVLALVIEPDSFFPLSWLQFLVCIVISIIVAVRSISHKP
jgi:hypothetical protein